MIKRYKSQRRFRPKRSRLKKIAQSRVFWFGLVFCALVGGVLYGVFFTPVLKIKHIEIQGNQKIAEQQLLDIISKSLPRNFAFLAVNNFLLLHTKEMEQEIRTSLPEIDLIRVKKKFPDVLQVVVQERQKVAVWCQQKNYTVEVADSEHQETRVFKQCFALDKNGVIFEEAEPTNDTVISAENREGSLGGSVVDSRLLASLLQFQKTMGTFALFQEAGLRISSLHMVSKERVNAKISEGWEIYFNPDEKVDWQITKAKLVLGQEIPAAKRPLLEYIDLRFGDQAYIKYR